MIAAQEYPITVVEVATFMTGANKNLTSLERETLTDYLAVHPEAGAVLSGTGGIRWIRWPLKGKKDDKRMRIAYFFRDLNMPLYLLALYMPGERIGTDAKTRGKMNELTNQLIAEHYCDKLARLASSHLEGA